MADETCRTGGILSKAVGGRTCLSPIRCKRPPTHVGEQLRECTVWDESETGARIIVDAPETVPDTFHIYMTLDFSSRRRCRVVWRSKSQIGVEFLR
jgi:PilZ domain